MLPLLQVLSLLLWINPAAFDSIRWERWVSDPVWKEQEVKWLTNSAWSSFAVGTNFLTLTNCSAIDLGGYPIAFIPERYWPEIKQHFATNLTNYNVEFFERQINYKRVN